MINQWNFDWEPIFQQTQLASEASNLRKQSINQGYGHRLDRSLHRPATSLGRQKLFASFRSFQQQVTLMHTCAEISFGCCHFNVLQYFTGNNNGFKFNDLCVWTGCLTACFSCRVWSGSGIHLWGRTSCGQFFWKLHLGCFALRSLSFLSQSSASPHYSNTFCASL